MRPLWVLVARSLAVGERVSVLSKNASYNKTLGVS
jgi:hypothetical protein